MKYILLTFFSAFVFWGAAEVSAKDTIYTGLFSSKAVSGYDTVSYFTQGKPVKGSDDYKTKWNGANWHFSSQENLDLFLANPEKYAPQYGGYCAWAVSQGYTASSDPEVWDIYNGKLYLNYDKAVQKTWRPKKNEFIALANENYPKLIK